MRVRSYRRNLFNFLLYQMANKDMLSLLESRAVEAQKLILSLKSEITALNKLTYTHCHDKECQDLIVENERLVKDIEIWKDRLIQAEVKNGKNPITTMKGESAKLESLPNNHIKSPLKINNQTKDESVPVSKKGKTDKEKSKKSKDSESTPKLKKESTDKDKGDDKVDVGRLDVRIGRILSADKHPDADSLYVESVDLGKEKRTVVSGLVRFIEKKDLDGRLVVLLCNLKPAKMRGIASEAMVLCASSPEKVEVLNPPAGSVPGDVVIVEGFEHRPDPVLNPKKKVWETVAADLKVNSDGIATYKGVALTVSGKGNIVTSSLKDVPIK